jgi:hypothetical protein
VGAFPHPERKSKTPSNNANFFIVSPRFILAFMVRLQCKNISGKMKKKRKKSAAPNPNLSSTHRTTS